MIYYILYRYEGVNHLTKSSQARAKNYMMIFMAVFLVLCALSGCIAGRQGRETAVNRILKDVNGEPVVPRAANRIYIMPLGNRTGRPELTGKLFLRISRNISMDGRLAVVSSREGADLALEGSIQDFSTHNIAYGDMGRPVRKRIRVTASLRMYDLKRGALIFADPEIQSFREFSDMIAPIETESAVVEYIIDNLAQRITAKAVTGWYTEFMTPVERGKK